MKISLNEIFNSLDSYLDTNRDYSFGSTATLVYMNFDGNSNKKVV